jgi:hypothetical protein
LGDKRAVEALWKVKDNTPYAIVAIAHLDYGKARHTLIERLDPKNPENHFEYAQEMIDILGEHREEKAVATLVSYLEQWESVFLYPPFFANIETTLKAIGTPQALKTIEKFRAYMDNPENRKKELAKISTEDLWAGFRPKPSWFRQILNKLILFYRNR